MTTVAGVALLLGGAAFAFLGLLTVIDLLRRRERPAAGARFGVAFLLVALTAAPYHALFGLRLLAEGTAAPGPLLIGALMTLLPLLSFVGLRVEALTGARAERFIPGIPTWLPALPIAVATVAGAATWVAIGQARRADFSPVGLGVELVVMVLSMAVGIVLLHAQVERRRLLSGWSLSALSLTALFPASGFAHAMAGLADRASGVELGLAALSVPATLHFLWVVRDLHRTLLVATRRRPLVGPAARAVRESPWSSPGKETSVA